MTGFTSGAKTLAEIIQDIAVKLIGSTGGLWEDITAYDAGASWTTSVKTENNARRALVYNRNGNEQMFFTMEAINASTSPTVWSAYYAKGIRMTWASAWDSGAHTFASSAIKTFVPFEMRYAAYPAADLTTLQVYYYLWVEEGTGNGFVITGKPEPNASDNYQQSFFIVMERVSPASHEYSIGNYGWWCMNVCNIYPTFYGPSWATSGFLHHSWVRPGATPSAWPVDGVDTNISDQYPNGHGISYGYLYEVAGYRTAFKSSGNGKVYYIKPVVNNSPTGYMPAFQSQLFFPYDVGLGLIDGDVIAIENSTVKFVCKNPDSPDSLNGLPFAMKYAE